MDAHVNIVNIPELDWLEVLLKEYDAEAKMESEWRTLLLQSRARMMVWNFCKLLGVSKKGVPGSACRLLEKYLSRHIRNFLQKSRDNEEWERYKYTVSSQFHLAMVSCIQLVAKMFDQTAPVNASTIRVMLAGKGYIHTKTEIVDMEFHVFKTLGFRIPLWSTLEISEYLGTRVGLTDARKLEAITNMTEFYRNELELRMEGWSDADNTTGPSSPTSELSGNILANPKMTLFNIHLCAAVVAAAARYMRSKSPDPAERLATMTRTSYLFIKRLSDIILNHVIQGEKHIPILKRRRLR